MRPSDIDKTTAVIETQPDAISKEPDATSSGSDTSKNEGVVNDAYESVDGGDQMTTETTTF